MTCLSTRGCSCICFRPFAPHPPPVCTSFFCVNGKTCRIQAPELGPAWEAAQRAGGDLCSQRQLQLVTSVKPCDAVRLSSVMCLLGFSHLPPLPGDFLLALQAASLRLELPWMAFMSQLHRSRPSILLEHWEVTWYRELTCVTKFLQN